MSSSTFNYRILRLLLRVIVVVGGVVGLKVVSHWLGVEVLALGELFSGIVAGVIFVMGLLLAGILTDYKESERLLDELVCSLAIIADEARAIYRTKQVPAANECGAHVLGLTVSIKDWFHKKQSTREIIAKLDTLGEFFTASESLIPDSVIVSFRQEHRNIRRVLIRVQTIRDTNFISSAYLVSGITTILLIVGMVLAKTDPFTEALFFTGIITFILVYLNLLIRDLDNPFGYYDVNSAEDVSLKPLEDLIEELNINGR